MRVNTILAVLPLIVLVAFYCPTISAQNKGDEEQTATGRGKNYDPTQPSAESRADGVYVDSLRADKVAGKAASDGFVDIYIYGPNNGNPRDVGNARMWGGPGSLAFHRKNIPVKSHQWSVAISPALQKERSNYYQININQPAEKGLTDSEHSQDALDLFRVNDGPLCDTQMSASFQKDTLGDAGQQKSLLAIDGYACNTSSITLIVTGEKGDVLKTTTKVVNGEWEAGKEMSIEDGTYTVQVYGDNNQKLTQGSILAATNTGTIDGTSLEQSVSSKDGCFITGTASVPVVACAVPVSYAGSTDFRTLVHLARSFQRGAQRVDVEPNLAAASEAPKFRIRLDTRAPGRLEPGTYRILLMEGTAAHNVLATAALTLTP